MKEFKLFLKQGVLFILPLIAFFGFCEYKFSTFKNLYNRKQEIFLSKANEIDTLILGSSHAV